MKTKYFLELVLKKQKWILAITAFSFCLSIYIYYLINNESKASVAILIPTPAVGANDYGASDAERFAFSQQMNVNSIRLFELINSDNMIEHINTKFNLYDHYNINKYDNYSWNRLKQKFQSNATFTRESDEKALVIFTDPDAVYAADIANEIVIKLIALNRDFVLSAIKQRGELYQNMISGINSDITGELSKMQGVISDFKAQSNLNERSIEQLNFKVDMITNEFGKLTTELVRIKQYYAWSQVAIENNLQNNLVILNKAIPDKKQFYFLEMISVGIVSVFVVVSGICFMLYLYLHLRSQWASMISN